MYLYVVKLLKNQNVLNTLKINIFAHAPNQALFKNISLVQAKLSMLRNVLQTIVNTILLKSLSFASCEDVALVNVSITFPCFSNFTNSKYIRFQWGAMHALCGVLRKRCFFVMQIHKTHTPARCVDDDCL